MTRAEEAMTIQERAEQVIRDWPQWSPAERRRMDEIVTEVLDHCRNGGGNRFIRDWCNRVLAPALRPLFS
jgi:hypothetical protein